MLSFCLFTSSQSWRLLIPHRTKVCMCRVSVEREVFFQFRGNKRSWILWVSEVSEMISFLHQKENSLSVFPATLRSGELGWFMGEQTKGNKKQMNTQTKQFITWLLIWKGASLNLFIVYQVLNVITMFIFVLEQCFWIFNSG